MRTQMHFVAAMVCLLGVAVTNVGAQGPKKPEPPQPPDETKIAKPKFLPMQVVPTRWEYRVLGTHQIRALAADNLEAGLNKLGAEAWELVGIEAALDRQPATYIFRRPAVGQPKPAAKPAPELAPKEKAEPKLQLRVFTLKHADAGELAMLLEALLRLNKTPMRIVADARTNQILVYSTIDLHLDIEALLRRLDQPADPLAPQSAPSPGPGPSKKKR